MLGMAYIRVYEVATFYTMFQLPPVGKKAHVQLCGTTPCMLRGAEALKDVCKRKIHHEPHHLSEDGNFSWEEVECLGCLCQCADGADLQGYLRRPDAGLLEKVLDGYRAGQPPKARLANRPQGVRPVGGQTTLTDPALFDGSAVGAWQKNSWNPLRQPRRLPQLTAAAAAPVAASTQSSVAPSAAVAPASTSAPQAAANFIAAHGSG